MVLLKTIHGSRLSGLARPDSDWDWYTVVEGGRTRQKITGDQDNVTVTLDDFLHFVADGEPQALAALWSPLAEIDVRYAPLFASLHPDMMMATHKFQGAITAFSGGAHHKVKSYAELEVKMRQHMCRLSLFLDHLWRWGRFCPVLDADAMKWIMETARLDEADFVAELARVSPVPLHFLWDGAG